MSAVTSRANSWRVAMALMLLLVACDSKPRDETPPAQIFGDQIRALDQARGVEKTLEQAEQKRRAETEERSQ